MTRAWSCLSGSTLFQISLRFYWNSKSTHSVNLMGFRSSLLRCTGLHSTACANPQGHLCLLCLSLKLRTVSRKSRHRLPSVNSRRLAFRARTWRLKAQCLTSYQHMIYHISALMKPLQTVHRYKASVDRDFHHWLSASGTSALRFVLVS